MKDKKTLLDGKTIHVANYMNNSRLAIHLYNNDGELFDSITINLSDMITPNKDEVFINADLSKDIVNELKKLGIIEESYGYRKYNMGQYEFVKINLDKLYEYDPIGVNNFESEYDIVKDMYSMSMSI